jgi:hypothetical protein
MGSIFAAFYSQQYYVTAVVMSILLALVAIFYGSWLNEWWEHKSEGVLVDFDATEQ